MTTVRYRPGEAMRWLETAANESKKSARLKSREMTPPRDMHGLGQNVVTAAGALMDLGKGAWAEMLRRQAEASEYILGDDSFEVVKVNSTRKFLYRNIKEIEQRGDKSVVRMESTSITIKPFAYIVAGRIRVPVGWVRNDQEVPFELLIEELSARCGIDLL